MLSWISKEILEQFESENLVPASGEEILGSIPRLGTMSKKNMKKSPRNPDLCSATDYFGKHICRTEIAATNHDRNALRYMWVSVCKNCNSIIKDWWKVQEDLLDEVSNISDVEFLIQNDNEEFLKTVIVNQFIWDRIYNQGFRLISDQNLPPKFLRDHWSEQNTLRKVSDELRCSEIEMLEKLYEES